MNFGYEQDTQLMWRTLGEACMWLFEVRVSKARRSKGLEVSEKAAWGLRKQVE